MARAWWLGLVLVVPACKTTQGPTPVAVAPKADPLLASGGSLHDPARAQAFKSGGTNTGSNGTATAMNTTPANGE
jgi:hypothetical protein